MLIDPLYLSNSHSYSHHFQKNLYFHREPRLFQLFASGVFFCDQKYQSKTLDQCVARLVVGLGVYMP
jgi:hypothetical protein